MVTLDPTILNRIAYSPKQATLVLPFGERTIRELLKTGRLGYSRIGRKILIPKTEIEKLLRKGFNKPTTGVDPDAPIFPENTRGPANAWMPSQKTATPPAANWRRHVKRPLDPEENSMKTTANIAHLYAGNTLADARRLVAAGLPVIPILPNGSKAPPLDWKCYQSRRPTEAELLVWFGRPRFGLAIVCGEISGHLEVLDFDASEVFAPWSDLVDELIPGLVQRLPVVHTPSDGRHVYYRCEVIEGNQKLAQAVHAHGKVKALIETRGEGGYIIAPGSPPGCHPLRKPYRLLDGDLADIPLITTDERALLLNAARSFNAYVEPERTIVATRTAAATTGDRPGDHYAAQTTWEDILEPHGWISVRQRGEVLLWKRPGKRERGWSATTGYAGSDLLYVFSVNAAPFEPERAYSKFAAYAWLNHAGDFTAAAKALAAAGYVHHHAPQKLTIRTPHGALRTRQGSEVPSWR